jgi:hypothetical protein
MRSFEVLQGQGGADRHGVRRSKKGGFGRSKKTSHQTSLRMKQVSSPSFCPVNPVLVGHIAAGAVGDQLPIARTMRGIHPPHRASAEADLLTFQHPCQDHKRTKLVSDPRGVPGAREKSDNPDR